MILTKLGSGQLLTAQFAMHHVNCRLPLDQGKTQRAWRSTRVFFLVVAIPALVLFPNAYMSIASAFMPDDIKGNLIGWRLHRLAGVIIGVAIFMVGLGAL